MTLRTRSLSRDAGGRARRGAADLAAYRNDLTDLARFLAARGVALEGADAAALHDYLARSTARGSGAADRWPAGFPRCGSSTNFCDRGRRAGRSDRAARHAAARAAVAEDSAEDEVESADRRRPTWPGERAYGSAASSNCSMRPGCASPSWSTLPLAAARRDPRFLVVRGKGGKERIVPLSEPARRALAEYLECRDRFPARSSGPRRAGCSRRAAAPGHLTRQRCRPNAEGTGARRPGSTRTGCRRMCCATPSPAICSTTAPICAACSRCSGMPTSRRRRSIRMCWASGCAGWSRPRIRCARRKADAPFSRFRAADRRARRQDRGAAPSVERRRASTSPTRSAGSKRSANRLLRQTYARLTPWQKVQVARHPERPHCARLHRRADRRFRAARRRPRLCRGCGGGRRHRPVSRPQRRRARHREGRRHRERGSSTISAWRGRKAIARRGG